MQSEQDLLTLQQAGIKDVNTLVSAAAAFLREHPVYKTKSVTNAFSVQEEVFLRQGGAVGIDGHDTNAQAENIAIIAGEYAQMVATAYTQKQVAEKLGVSTSRIRQRIDANSLYSIEGSGGRLCPNWQFTDGVTIPGLESVLASISHNAHPVAVQRFFLTPSVDLESDTINQILSPRDWLITGHSPQAVVLLAREL